MRRKRKRSKVTVIKNRRVYRVVKVTRKVLQCERPYVLFGAAVCAARLRCQITQQELADRLKISRGSVANIETARQRVLLDDVFQFAEALRVSPRSLFDAVQA
ncbi:MAG: helix-turn-helix transcriptional regulator [Hyphomicrobiales bacterium]|nr:helix-turn-helix transcriptional regulator [Hyphomicrobiales bacterium]